MAIQKTLEGAGQLGAGTRLIDLRHYELVFANGSKNQTELPGVAKLSEEVKRADANPHCSLMSLVLGRLPAIA